MVDSGADFVVVGAYALAVHGFPRATGDIDVFVRPSPENATRVLHALLAFGAPLEAHGVTEADFASAGNVYQIGLPPRRIDILTSLSGISFDDAVRDAITGKVGPVTVRFIGREAMLHNKRATGRLKDLADAQLLDGSASAHDDTAEGSRRETEGESDWMSLSTHRTPGRGRR